MTRTMAIQNEAPAAEPIVPITGRALTLPEGPIFHLQRADEADYEIGAFRRWAGYKTLGVDAATNDLVLFQHVLSFGRRKSQAGPAFTATLPTCTSSSRPPAARVLV